MAHFSKFTRYLGLTAAAAALAGVASAGGTNAGTAVENVFTLTYEVGGATQPVITNDGVGGNDAPTLFTVDRLVDLTVTAAVATQDVAPGSTDNETVFTVRNDGNDVQAYGLSVLVASDTYTPGTAPTQIFYAVDSDDDGILDAAERAAMVLYNGTNTVNVAPDDHLFVIVQSDVPTATPDNRTATLQLVADTLYPTQGDSFDTACDATICPQYTPVTADPTTAGDDNAIAGAAENVLADLNGGLSIAQDADNDGNYSAATQLDVVAPTLAASKAVTVLDTDPADDAACASAVATPVADQYSSPGACVLYTISVANTGAGTASNLNITDQLPTGLRFIKAEISQGATTTAGNGFDDYVTTPTNTAGPNLSAPATPTDCNGTGGACDVVLSDAILESNEDAAILIWARVK